MVGAGENEPPDSVHGGGFVNVEHGVHVRSEQFGPVMVGHGVAGQVNDRLRSLEMTYPISPIAQVSSVDSFAAFLVEQHQTGATPEMAGQFGSEITTGTGNEHRGWELQGFSPVISESNRKKPRLRSLLIFQFTGTLW